MVKQLKNRYNDPTLHRRFILGIDRSKMKLYDVQEDDQVLFEQMGKGSESVDDEEDMSKFKIKKPRSLSGWGE
jgi:hypothetical protein